MASQSVLESQIRSINEALASAELQLAALRETNDDPIAVADLEAYIQELENQLFDTESQLQNISIIDDGSDPYTYNGQSTIQEYAEWDAPPTISPDEDPFESARLAAAANLDNTAPTQEALEAWSRQGITAPLFNTRSQAGQQDSVNAAQQGDWRVRLSLAPGAKYLYKGDSPGILEPLIATDGVIFPYVPQVTVNYAANYDQSDLTHSNFKIFQYRSSSVDTVSITGDFTAQDTFEAEYLLAVIHFFRSVTKMFYGQDQYPKNGTPPPLCYLTGLGAFQFDQHPLAVTQFNYSLPNEVDYIRAGSTTTLPGVNKNPAAPRGDINVSDLRLGSMIGVGGSAPGPNFKRTPSGTVEPTYVPTKMQIQISAIPIVTRNSISNNFSLKDYASGALLRGSVNKKIGGGIW